MKNWSTYIKQFLGKQLAERDRFELEKTALDDDFLFEAWQGYNENPDSQHLQNLSQLEGEISKKKKHTPTIPMWQKYLPYVAAASILLVSSLYFLLPSKNKLAQEETALIVSIPPEEAPLALESPENNSILESIPISSTETLRDQTQEITASKKSKSTSKDAPINTISRTTEIQNTSHDQPVLASAPKPTNMRSENIEMSVSRSLSGENDNITNDTTLVFRNGKSKEKVSGESGTEDISSVVDASLKNTQGEIMAISFENIPTYGDSSIILTRDATPVTYSLEELAMRRKTQTKGILLDRTPIIINNQDQAIDTSQFRPVVGYDAYRKHLSELTEYKREWFFMRDINVENGMTIRMSFDIDRAGIPIDSKLERSSNFNYLNEEALRLIQVGGKWVRTDPAKRIEYIIEFPF